MLADRRSADKTLEQFDSGFSPKVRGLEQCLKALSDEPLRMISVFSSAAARSGNVGQADYAMANEVLNKAAHLIASRYPACRARALDFGPWGGGMVTPTLQKMFEEGRRFFANVVFQVDDRPGFGDGG